MEYSPTCLNDRGNRRAAELIGCALSDNASRILRYKALEALAGEGTLKAALLCVDLRVKLKKARAAVQLCLLGLDGRLLLICGSPLLRNGLDKAIKLCDLLSR